MAQNYPQIDDVESIKDSRQQILDRDDALRTCFSGALAPTGAVVPQFWFDTASQQLKQLKSTGPDVWVVIADLTKTYLSTEAADGFYATAGHVHTAAVVTFAANVALGIAATTVQAAIEEVRQDAAEEAIAMAMALGMGA